MSSRNEAEGGGTDSMTLRALTAHQTPPLR